MRYSKLILLDTFNDLQIFLHPTHTEANNIKLELVKNGIILNTITSSLKTLTEDEEEQVGIVVCKRKHEKKVLLKLGMQGLEVIFGEQQEVANLNPLILPVHFHFCEAFFLFGGSFSRS